MMNFKKKFKQFRVFPSRSMPSPLFCQDGSPHVYRIDRGSDLDAKASIAFFLTEGSSEPSNKLTPYLPSSEERRITFSSIRFLASL